MRRLPRGNTGEKKKRKTKQATKADGPTTTATLYL